MNRAKKEQLAPTTERFLKAVYSNNIAAVRQCVKRDKVNPNLPDVRQTSKPTALHYAAENQLINLARALLELKKPPVKVNVNAEDADGRRPVWWAAQYGNTELAELLVKAHKCDVDFLDRKTGCTPLYRAIVTGAPEVCAILVHGGANVNLRRLGYDVGAESPLMKAVQMDNLEICKVLVNSLVDLDYKTEDGYTALHYAIAYHRYDIVEFLLESRIKKHSSSHSGVTAMTIAIEHLNPAMVLILIKFGYNMNKLYKWKETPLHQAISLHDQKCALTLVHWGCSLRTPSRNSRSYFRLACETGLDLLIRLLVLIKPEFLQEDWIQKGRWPLALQSEAKTEIYNWVSYKLQHPLRLKELARSAIFRRIQYFPARYKKLELPSALLDYISFANLIDERMYKRIRLADSCPLDCDSLHPWKEGQCPDVEISDIDGETDYSDLSEEEEASSEGDNGEDNEN